MNVMSKYIGYRVNVLSKSDHVKFNITITVQTQQVHLIRIEIQFNEFFNDDEYIGLYV
jgi:hypothetical protein